MQARLILYVLGVALLVAASAGSIANQSDRFVGFHEVPPFVCDRVELVPSLAVDGSPSDVGPSRSERVAPDEIPVPASVNPLCIHGAGGWAFDRLASTPRDREVARNRTPAGLSKAARDSERPIWYQRGNPNCLFPLPVM